MRDIGHWKRDIGDYVSGNSPMKRHFLPQHLLRHLEAMAIEGIHLVHIQDAMVAQEIAHAEVVTLGLQVDKCVLGTATLM